MTRIQCRGVQHQHWGFSSSPPVVVFRLELRYFVLRLHEQIPKMPRLVAASIRDAGVEFSLVQLNQTASRRVARLEKSPQIGPDAGENPASNIRFHARKEILFETTNQ